MRMRRRDAVGNRTDGRRTCASLMCVAIGALSLGAVQSAPAEPTAVPGFTLELVTGFGGFIGAAPPGAYPSTVMLFSTVGSDLLVFALQDDAAIPFAFAPDVASGLRSVKFDPFDSFGPSRFILHYGGSGPDSTYVLAPDGSIELIGETDAPGFGGLAVPNGLGALVYDGFGQFGQGWYQISPGSTNLEGLSVPALPPGRQDIDTRDLSLIDAREYPAGILVADHDDEENLTAIYILETDETPEWRTLVPTVPATQREWLGVDEIAFPGFEQRVIATDRIGGTVSLVSPDGDLTTVASGFLNLGKVATDASTGQVYLRATGGVYRLRPDGLAGGPRVLATIPTNGLPDPIRSDSAIPVVTIVLSEPVSADPVDIEVSAESGTNYQFVLFGSETQTLSLQLVPPLSDDSLEIVIGDGVVALDGRALDGDGDGIVGGAWIGEIEHRLASDVDGSGEVGFEDLLKVLSDWTAIP